ncbi:hypothetical protein [Comamonas sp. 23]|uniref:hypothetical protein n=1 Tax=Comamonas sp. 23 TaxID=3415008 RepID=UPI003C6FF022
MDIDEFEINVMRLALRGSDDWVVKMRSQIPHLKFSKREHFNCGFVTSFNHSSKAESFAIPREDSGLPVSGYPPAINARRRYPEDGLVSFLVWLGEDGVIDRLEAVSLTDDKWPENIFDGFYDFQDDSECIVQVIADEK